MVLKILAWDDSGSTAGVSFYFATSAGYLDQFQSAPLEEGDEKIYLQWNSNCRLSSYAKLKQVCASKKGCGGTSPSEIVNWILQKKPNEGVELWLITDGHIESHELATCARLNAGVNYTAVKFIIIDQSRRVNMSVGAAFFAGAQLEIYRNESLFKSVNTAKPFDYASINVHNYQTKWEELSDYIQAKFMGSDRESLEEVDKLVALRTRLLKSLADAEGTANGQGEGRNPLRPIFPSTAKQDIIDVLRKCPFYTSLTSSSVRDARRHVDGSISTLINYIHNKHKSLEFQDLAMEFKQCKLETVMQEDEPRLEDLVDADEEPVPFFDAVSLEEDGGQPVLLLHVHDIIEKIWVQGSYSKFRQIIDCPFTAPRLEDTIGHVFSTETYQGLVETASQHGDSLKNPMTNLPIGGGLIFPTTPNSDVDKWNDYVLLRSLFRGKVVTKDDLGLWYYMIWKSAEGLTWIEPAVMEKFYAYTARRLKAMGPVRLGFSTLPLEPRELVPLPVACFYCAELSSRMFGEDATLYTQEKLRMYAGAARHFLDILDMFGYKSQVDTEFVQRRAELWKLVNQLKRIPQLIEKRYFLFTSIFNVLREDFGDGTDTTFLTYEVKDKARLWSLNLLRYSHREKIPFDIDVARYNFGPDVLVNYKYNNKYDVELSTETFRPVFVIREGEGEFKPNYAQILECVEDVSLNVHGEVKIKPVSGRLDQRRLFSATKAFIDVVEKLGAFPTLAEYASHVANTTRVSGGTHVRLLPPNIGQVIRDEYEVHMRLVRDSEVKLDAFLGRARQGTSVAERIRMESKLTGKDNQFIEGFVQQAKKEYLR